VLFNIKKTVFNFLNPVAPGWQFDLVYCGTTFQVVGFFFGAGWHWSDCSFPGVCACWQVSVVSAQSLVQTTHELHSAYGCRSATYIIRLLPCLSHC